MKILANILVAILFFGCAQTTVPVEEKVVISTSPEKMDVQLEIEYSKGPHHNHPSFAIWVEDVEGEYVETLFVTQYVGSGVFGRGEIEPGRWSNKPGAVRRPASLPYWAHKRNIKAPDGLYVPSPETAVPDALSGATPQGNFILHTGTSETNHRFRVLFEINQPWDSNRFWTNGKFPGNNDYMASLQPSLVYAATIDRNDTRKEYQLYPVGHGHPTGADGSLNRDLGTLTTAKEITGTIVVLLK